MQKETPNSSLQNPISYLLNLTFKFFFLINPFPFFPSRLVVVTRFKRDSFDDLCLYTYSGRVFTNSSVLDIYQYFIKLKRGIVRVCFGPSLREPRYFSIKKVFGIFYGYGIGKQRLDKNK